MWTGVAVPEHFWQQYLHTLSGALLLAVVFALGALTYDSMRDQLRRTEEKLHEKEVAEERTAKLVAEARLRSLESRLHPHFLFNTLNSISALVRIDAVRAEQMVGRLSALLRASLDNSSRSLIPLDAGTRDGRGLRRHRARALRRQAARPRRGAGGTAGCAGPAALHPVAGGERREARHHAAARWRRGAGGRRGAERAGHDRGVRHRRRLRPHRACAPATASTRSSGASTPCSASAHASTSRGAADGAVVQMVLPRS